MTMFRLTMLSFYANVLVLLLIPTSAASTSRFQARSALRTYQSRDEEPATNAADAMAVGVDFGSSSDDLSSSVDEDLSSLSSSSSSSSSLLGRNLLQTRRNTASGESAVAFDGRNNDEWVYHKVPKTRFLGCYALDSSLANGDNVYEGSTNGAYFELALTHAMVQNKKYFAMARGQAHGHLSTFNKLLNVKFDGNDVGCFRPCLDANDKFCGCETNDCIKEGSTKVAGQEHVRRWAVYERVN